MQNKKAIELSVNFLVVLIISIVLFGMGVSFVYKIVKGVQDYQDIEEKRVMKELENTLCGASDLVCVPFFTKEVKPGQRAVFGVKIVNTDSSQKKFKLDFAHNSLCFIDKNNAKQSCTGSDLSLLDIPEVTISPKESVSKLVVAQIKDTAQRPGTYILDFAVYVEKSGESVTKLDGTTTLSEYGYYGPKQKLYVKVK